MFHLAHYDDSLVSVITVKTQYKFYVSAILF
jgi:hypothetical protein